MTRTFTIFILIQLFFFPIFLSGQVFWQEDFSNGFPEGWSTTDQSVNNFLWTWCGDPNNGRGDGCPPIFDEIEEGQVAFSSTSAANGFMTCDSDIAGEPLNTNHVSILTTSAIDCSGKEEVYLQFQTHFGLFAKDASMQAIVRVSNDSVSWSNFIPFTDLFGLFTDRWSDNPEKIMFDISEVAANQATVYIQWFWVANYDYVWSIDDVELTDIDPTPIHELLVDPNFFILPPYYQVPISQVQPMRFLADVINIGQASQTNVKLEVTIQKSPSGVIVHRDSLLHGTMVRDQLVENIVFLETFTPTEQGIYAGTYCVTSDSIQDCNETNSKSFTFLVTEDIFSKAPGGNPIALRPGDGNWSPNQPHSWGYGVHFQIPAGENIYAEAIQFGIANPEALEGEQVTLWLYEWEDINGNGDSEFDERVVIGFGSYEILGSEQPVGTIDWPIENTNQTPILLDNSREFLAMIQFEASGVGVDLEVQTEVFLDYKAQFTISDSLDVNPKYHSFAYIGNPSGTFIHNPFNLASGKMELTPNIRLRLGGDLVRTQEIHGVAFKTTLYPNPAQDQLYYQVESSEAFEISGISIYDWRGKLLIQTARRMEPSEQLDLSTLPAGSYIIQFNTNKGILSEKFIKAD